MRITETNSHCEHVYKMSFKKDYSHNSNNILFFKFWTLVYKLLPQRTMQENSYFNFLSPFPPISTPPSTSATKQPFYTVKWFFLFHMCFIKHVLLYYVYVFLIFMNANGLNGLLWFVSLSSHEHLGFCFALIFIFYHKIYLQ